MASMTQSPIRETYIDARGTLRRLSNPDHKALTPNEEEKAIRILQFVADGVPLKAVDVSANYQCRKNILGRFYVKHRLENMHHAIAFAFRKGWIK